MSVLLPPQYNYYYYYYRQREANKRVRRLLGEERRSLVLTQKNYAAELALRTDLELLLREHVEEVGKDLFRRYNY